MFAKLNTKTPYVYYNHLNICDDLSVYQFVGTSHEVKQLLKDFKNEVKAKEMNLKNNKKNL